MLHKFSKISWQAVHAGGNGTIWVSKVQHSFMSQGEVVMQEVVAAAQLGFQTFDAVSRLIVMR